MYFVLFNHLYSLVRASADETIIEALCTAERLLQVCDDKLDQYSWSNLGAVTIPGMK